MSEGKRVIDERREVRGPYKDQANLCQLLKSIFREKANWRRLPLEQRESLDNIANKIARILTGDHDELDAWGDISGYAELAIIEIKEGKGD